MPSSNILPLGPNYALMVSSSVLIDAPIDKVWDILSDFLEYPKWNSCVRSIKVVSPSKVPLADQKPAIGKHLALTIHVPPTMGKPIGLFGSLSVFGMITHIDQENCRIAWKTAGLPSFVFSTHRWQALSVEPATGQTKYETVEVFGGILAYFVRYFMGDKLHASVGAAASNLKTRSEDRSI